MHLNTVVTAPSYSPARIAARGTDVYTMYTGNGESSWPGIDQWWSTFEEM
jgi:hypothetical protein